MHPTNTPPTSPTHTCPHPTLDDLWDNATDTWAVSCDILCDDCLQELHDATCMCDSAVSHATRDDTNVPLPDVVGRADIIAHIHGATIDEAHDARMDYCIDCQRDYDAMTEQERALHVCDAEMIIRTCKNNPNTL